MKVYLRDMDDADLELIMAWRSNHLVYDLGCYTQKAPLSWAEHYPWCHSRGRWWRFFIVVVDDGVTRPRDVGVVNIAQLDNFNPEFNWYLGEVSFGGHGVGTAMLTLVFEWLKAHGYCKTHTTSKADNIPARKNLLAVGCESVCEARKGELRWEKKLQEEDEATEYTSGRKPYMRMFGEIELKDK